MPDPADDKIEQLVRSVLAAVDARLTEVRHELQAVAVSVEQRHREALQHMQDLEHRLERRAADNGASTTDGDPLAARMEQATQVLLERIEAMHQRNTIATNERFALINQTLEQIRGEHDATPITVPVMPALDAMNAPLRVGPVTAPTPVVAASTPTIAPIAAPLPSFSSPAAVTAPVIPAPAIPAPVVAPPVVAPVVVAPAVAAPVPVAAPAPEIEPAPSTDGSEPIDLARLADLLGERLGQLNIPKSSS
jgi:flagellar biosynthesis/type III secretory pathway chaperone